MLKNKSIIDYEAPIFPISIVATMLEVHQRTLRIYDEENLLVPKRSGKNRRLYSMADVERGKFIQFLTRELGINLSGVRIIFTLLEEQKIQPKNFISHIQTIASNLNITPEIQEKTKQKMSKRGRKAKNEKV